jgi:hypothetical protein
MSLTKTTASVSNIQDLSDTPNATEGLTADQLKKKFDDYGIDNKTYINEVLTVELDTELATKITTSSIVNDLTTGGVAVPLSAEQGKTLQNLKAPLASPTFTGTVVLPATTSIGNVSNTEIGYLDGVTSAIQTQLGAGFVAKGTVTSDFNNYTATGMYTYGGGDTLANRPPDYGIMCVFNSSDYKAQVVINGIFKIYFRFNDGASWSAWKTLTGI